MTKLKDDEGQPYLFEADKIYKEYSKAGDFLLASRNYVVKHAQNESENYKPRSILESRFTPALEAFNKGMTSCGALTNILTEMLRHVGFKVKLIHGEVPNSVDHAWLAVYNNSNEIWEEFDLTRDDGKVTPDHKKKLVCNSWVEIRDQIEEDHETGEEREKLRKELK